MVSDPTIVAMARASANSCNAVVRAVAESILSFNNASWAAIHVPHKPFTVTSSDADFTMYCWTLC